MAAKIVPGPDTPQHVLAWGYDPDAVFSLHDEHLIVESPRLCSHLFPAFLHLAADADCPKSSYALKIIDTLGRKILLHEHDRLPHLEGAIQLAASSGHRQLESWARSAKRLLGYLKTPFEVDQKKALKMGRDLLLGLRGKKSVALTETPVQAKRNGKPHQYWELVWYVDRPRPKGYLYISRDTGQFLFRWKPMKPIT